MKSHVSIAGCLRACSIVLLLALGCGGNKSTANGVLGDSVGGSGGPDLVGGAASGGTGSQAAAGSGVVVGAAGRTGGSGLGGVAGAGDVRTSAGAGGNRSGGSGGANMGTGGESTASGGAGGSAGGTGGNAGAAGRGADGCAPAPGAELGWAFESGNGVDTTKGGEGGAIMSVTTLDQLSAAVKGTNAQIIEIKGSISGTISIGSNKTLIGCAGAQFKGHISMNGSVNVIVRNLKIVGNNCTDNPSDCSGGQDAITVQTSAHHLWFDHDDISDGSDGNLDITHGSDFITISWTKFHYSGRRTDPAGAAGGHQFSNLIGHDDSNGDDPMNIGSPKKEDTGHLNVTFHHNWWAENVVERMPRTRFGKIHVLNNLYTSSGNDYCIGVGIFANVLTENNVFIGVQEPIRIGFSEPTASFGSVRSVGNVYMSTSGTAPADHNPASVFTPPYTYSPEATSSLEAAIRSGAGPR